MKILFKWQNGNAEYVAYNVISMRSVAVNMNVIGSRRVLQLCKDMKSCDVSPAQLDDIRFLYMYLFTF